MPESTPLSCLSAAVWARTGLFIYLKVEEMSRDIFHSLVHSPRWLELPALSQVEARSLSAAPVWVWPSSPWAVFCFPWMSAGNLVGNSWDRNQYPNGQWVSQVAALPTLPQYQRAFLILLYLPVVIILKMKISTTA